MSDMISLQNGDNRNGTNLDKRALEEVFTDFGFTVRIHCNLEGKKLSQSIDNLAKEDFSSYACLIVCILSHGLEGYVLGTDNEKVDINELKKKFKSSKELPTLNGKPKIFIIQACQGSDKQKNLSNAQLGVHVHTQTTNYKLGNIGNSVFIY